MSDHVDQLDQAIIGNLRCVAQEGRSPSELVHELRRCLGSQTHIVTILNYLRQAFCLTLADVKPIAALSRNEPREIEDENRLNELLLPAIQRHRSDWEKPSN